MLLGAGAAAAQEAQPLTPSDPSQALPQAPASGSPLENLPAAPEPSAAPAEAEAFVLETVEFHGATVLGPEQLAPAWQSYRGKPVTLRDLRAIASAGEKIYAASGHPFVAFVVPAQDVRGGAVRIEVIEGRITDLTILGRDPVARRQAAAAFQPLVGVQPLTVEQVERAYELAQDVPGLTLAGSLRPGSQARGMDLVVKAERRAWRFYVNVNNFYPDPVGPWGVLLGAEYNGASRYGDQTSLQLFSTTDIDEQQVVRFSHMRRLNSSGTAISAAILYANADPQGAVAPLDLATEVLAARVELQQPFIKRSQFSLTGAVALDWTDQETLVFSNIDLTKDKLRVLVGRLFGQWSPNGRPVADYEVEVRQGLSAFGASDEGDFDLSRFGADPQATVIKASVSGEIGQPMKPRLAWRVEGQWSSSGLAAPEEFVVGNLTVGRGYEPGAAFADRAVAVSLEGRFGSYRLRPDTAVEPYVFFDAAKLWNEEVGAPDDRWVASAGGGFRFDILQKARLDVFYAQPLHSPLGLGEPKPGGGVYMNLTAAIPDIFSGFGSGVRRTARP